MLGRILSVGFFVAVLMAFVGVIVFVASGLIAPFV